MKMVIAGNSVWINYHHLYCFYIIVGQGSLLQASQVLGIGVSALSIQMKQFEESLNHPLFVRSHRKLAPNELGKIVFNYAIEIFRLGTEMVETINDNPGLNRTHLQIGTLDTIAKPLTVELVSQAIIEKNCSVTIVEGRPEELLKSLMEHKIDLMLTNFLPLVAPGQVYSKRIAKLPLWVVGGHSFLRCKKNFPYSLSGQKFVVPTGDSRARHEFDNFCRRMEISLEYVAEAQDVTVQKLLALKEVGLTVVPKLVVQDCLEQKSLFLIGELAGIFEEIYLVSASRKIENPVASYLMSRFQIK